MNATTIHFLQDNEQLSANQTTTAYSWSTNLDNNLSSIPIQQVHYMEPNLTFINNTSTKLIQMNSSLESINQTKNNLLANNDDQTTYLTPLINVTLSESLNKQPINKLLPITIEAINSTDYNQQVNSATTVYYSDNNLINNSTLPSMATSFGSSIFVQSNCNNEINNNNISNSNNLNCDNPINKLNNKKLTKSTKITNKTSLSVNSKPGRKPMNKGNDEKLKYINELNSSKIIKKTGQPRGRKRLSNNLINNLASSNLISNLPPSTNSSTNLTINLINQNHNHNHKNSLNSHCSIVSNNLNNSTNSADSTGRFKKPNDPNDPRVKRRNSRERMRVRNLNDGYNNLRSKLPNEGKKLSKVETLRRAIHHIKELLKKLDQPASLNNFNSRNNNIQNVPINIKSINQAGFKYMPITNNKSTNQMDNFKNELHKFSKSELNSQLNNQINYYNY